MSTYAERLQAEIDRANAVTEAVDTTVHDAVTTLIEGYGKQSAERLYLFNHGSTLVPLSGYSEQTGAVSFGDTIHMTSTGGRPVAYTTVKVDVTPYKKMCCHGSIYNSAWVSSYPNGLFGLGNAFYDPSASIARMDMPVGNDQTFELDISGVSGFYYCIIWGFINADFDEWWVE